MHKPQNNLEQLFTYFEYSKWDHLQKVTIFLPDLPLLSLPRPCLGTKPIWTIIVKQYQKPHFS